MTNPCAASSPPKRASASTKNRFVDVAAPQRKIRACRPTKPTAQSIADRGVTLLRDTAKLLPLDSTRPPRVLLVALSADPDPFPGETIEPEIRPRVDSLTVLRADTQFNRSALSRFPDPDAYDVAIAASSCAWPTAKATSAFPTISAPSSISFSPGQAHRGRLLRQSLFNRTLPQRAHLARRIFHQRCVPARFRPRYVRTRSPLADISRSPSPAPSTAATA